MLRYEIIMWWSKLLFSIPGSIGCVIRNKLLPYKAGRNSKIWDSGQIDYPSRLELGQNVSINRWCIINAAGGVKIGNDTLIGPRATIYSQNHTFEDPTERISAQGYEKKPVTIGNDVWIASNVTILPGVTIGDGCVIAAGSVITKNTPPYSITAGVPGKIIGKRATKSHASKTETPQPQQEPN